MSKIENSKKLSQQKFNILYNKLEKVLKDRILHFFYNFANTAFSNIT